MALARARVIPVEFKQEPGTEVSCNAFFYSVEFFESISIISYMWL